MHDFAKQCEIMNAIAQALCVHVSGRDVSSAGTYFGFYSDKPNRGYLLSVKNTYIDKIPQRYYYLEILDMTKDPKESDAWFAYFFTHPSALDGEIEPWMISDHFCAMTDDSLLPEGERKFPRRQDLEE